MGKRLYCGNLPFAATTEEIRALFAEDGRTVSDVHIVTDRETGRPRGFAFVELESDEDAAKAVQAVNGRMFGGRSLTVNEARERAPRSGGGGGFRGPPGGGHSDRPRGPRPDFQSGPPSDFGPPPEGGDRRGRRGGGRDRERGRGGRRNDGD